MDKFEANSRMTNLIRTLNHYTKLYDLGIPSVSDAEWDKLYFELVELEKEFPSLIQEDSPTQKINYAVVNELKKVKHEYQPMLSLAKTKDIEEIKSFIDGKEWIAMLKLDGLTCRLTYEEGRLIRAETRGNVIEGEDVTHNAMVNPSIPKYIPYYDTLVVDGEMICDLNTFETFKGEYANARNFAAGSIRLLDSKECASRNLTFVAWDIILDEGDDEWTELSSKLMWLYNYGFTVVPFFLNGDYETIEDVVASLERVALVENYPIDGLVFKWDNCPEYESAGRTDHHFRGGLAYKFYDEEYETELLDIEWTMGRTGVLTPVAIYKDVDTGDSINNRASLHNINIMQDILGEEPYIGQKIWIAKMNQIIPQVTRADKESAQFITLCIPEVCPICGGETAIRESSTGTIELMCENPQCEGKLVNRIDHFAGKKGLDIKGLSKATLEKLIDWGWVSCIGDIFNLDTKIKEWIDKPGFGEKSVEKLLTTINEARECTFEQYISALGIPLIGKTYAKQIADELEDYETFRSKMENGFNFMKLAGFGPAMHDALINFNYAEADMLVHSGIIKFKEAEKVQASPSLQGLVICVTGKLVHFKNRDLLKAEITARGGKVTDSVTSKTSYLVNNDINSTSAKNKKAKELNIPIITEEDIMKMF